jgi:hypothetical protein
VGVVKKTRFHREIGRRIFIFKLVEGEKARPLWMGSKLGGILQDFCIINNSGKSGLSGTSDNSGKTGPLTTVRSLETTSDGRYVVAEYRWEGFGLAFERFLIKNTDKKTALKYFDL